MSEYVVRFELDDSDGPSCPVCLGEVTQIGTLGDRMYFRCRRCGADSSITEAAWAAQHGEN